MTERKPPEWSPTVPLAEVERRVGAILWERVRELPEEDRERIMSASSPWTMCKPVGGGWTAYWVELGNGETIDRRDGGKLARPGGSLNRRT
jgi:hypothetical protein